MLNARVLTNILYIPKLRGNLIVLPGFSLIDDRSLNFWPTAMLSQFFESFYGLCRIFTGFCEHFRFYCLFILSIFQ